MKNSWQNKSYILFFLILVSIGLFMYFYQSQQGKIFKFKANTVYPAPSAIHEISLLNNRAEPNELIIHLNDRVQFNSKDNKKHDIALGKGNDYGMKHEHIGGDSGNFGPGEGYLVTFKKVGTYYFHDDFNPNIFITILVY